MYKFGDKLETAKHEIETEVKYVWTLCLFVEAFTVQSAQKQYIVTFTWVKM